jgi:cytochrome c biogenesis protein CcmG, thiol:disulfide interchange protein DsbE
MTGREPSPGPARARTTRTARYTAVAVGLVTLGLIIVLAKHKSGEQSIRNQFLGRNAPPVEGVSAVDNARFSLAEQRGKFVIVNFFATWCPPCRKEQPELVALEAAHAKTGDVSLVSVVYQDQVDDVRDFFKKNGGTWPVINSDRIAVDWGVRGVPETYVVDRNGLVVYQYNGGVTKAALEKVLTQAGAT